MVCAPRWQAPVQAADLTVGVSQVEVTAKSSGDGPEDFISLTCRLISCLEATITIEATLANLEPSHPLPYTFVARNQQPEVVLTFTPIQRGQSTHYSFSYTSHCGGNDGRHNPRAVYRLPYPRVKSYAVSQGNFGRNSHGEGSGNEYAVDWAMPEGSMVLAARGGIVVGIKQDSNVGGAERKFDTAGNFIVVRHDDGTCAEYFHLRYHGAVVKLGQRITPGMPLALSGNTGQSTGPHLHVAIFVNRTGSERTCLPVRWLTKHGPADRLEEDKTY